ncbi:MAG: aquaporin family protein [Caulobacterales bacterium]|nr:aquaporin family protein [Caulobacterales bacterium]
MPIEPATARRLLSEMLGTALLLATVVGSGVMAESLSGGNQAIALLCNALATGCILVVLITLFAPVSGAHFNPVVTLAFLMRGEVTPGRAIAYVLVQISGAVLGVLLAHAMFDLPLIQASDHVRSGVGLWMSEGAATFGLVLVVLGGVSVAPNAVPWLVGLYITAAYWFTASTSFANPVVTIARAMTNTFSGIAPASVAGFILAQIVGAMLATALARPLFRTDT